MLQVKKQLVTFPLVVRCLMLVFCVLAMQGFQLITALFMELLCIFNTGKLFKHEFLVLLDVITAGLDLCLHIGDLFQKFFHFDRKALVLFHESLVRNLNLFKVNLYFC